MSETSQFIAPHQAERRRAPGSGGGDPGQRSPLEVSAQPHTHLSGSASQVSEGSYARCNSWPLAVLVSIDIAGAVPRLTRHQHVRLGVVCLSSHIT